MQVQFYRSIVRHESIIFSIKYSSLADKILLKWSIIVQSVLHIFRFEILIEIWYRGTIIFFNNNNYRQRDKKSYGNSTNYVSRVKIKNAIYRSKALLSILQARGSCAHELFCFASSNDRSRVAGRKFQRFAITAIKNNQYWSRWACKQIGNSRFRFPVTATRQLMPRRGDRKPSSSNQI